jgi:GT2 family glycosyltransferase
VKKRHTKLSDKYDISATIVLYEEDIRILKKTVESFLQIPFKKRLFLIDNSKSNFLEKEFNHTEINYQFIGKNIGFGAGHNLVLEQIKDYSKYHLILNPDVSFSGEVISSLIKEFQNKEDIAMIAPKIVFPDGKYQNSCRRYPSLRDLFIRRSGFLKRIFISAIQKGEYADKDLTKSFYPDFVHGCFMLFKTDDFIKIGGFDKRYFLYMEDVDICKKIDQIGKKKEYHPHLSVIHILKKDSSKNLSLFFIHFVSSIKFFKKWGF